MDVLPTPDQELGWRLAQVEDRLEALSERLGRLETSLRQAVADEVHGATAELRRAISELGRRLVQDLPAQLARHRDAIVAELRPPPPPPAPVVAEPPPPGDAEAELDDHDGGTDDDGDDEGDEGDDEVTAGSTSEAVERRRGRRRRRQG